MVISTVDRCIAVAQGRSVMPVYRFYCLDGKNNIETGEWIDAKNDEDAIMIAHARRRLVNGELWHAKRLVAKIPAYRESERPTLGSRASRVGPSSGKRRIP